MQDRDIILAIDDVEPGLVKAVKQHSKRLGKKLKGIALNDVNYPDARSRARDTSGLFQEIVCDFNNQDDLQTSLKPYLNRIRAVTCRQESSIHAFQKVIPFLPYVDTPSESALQWSTEKYLMRDRLRAYDPKLIPKYRYLTNYSLNDVQEIAREFSFPMIVKPNGLAASVLVTRCNNEQELFNSLAQTFEVIYDIYSRDGGRGEPSVLVEEMIQGEMYSIDAYISPKGDVYCLPLVKVVTAHSLGLEGFYSYRHVIPTGLSKSQVNAAHQAAKDSIRALNLSASSAHIELFCSPEGWKIIEVGPRIGGYREALYREAYGVDHYYNDLAVRMGDEPIIPTEPIKHAAGINIYAEAEGRIKSIEGVERAKGLSSVVYLDLHAGPGDLALFAGNGGRLIVDGILSNKDIEKLEADIAQVRELVKINVKPARPVTD